MTVIMQASSAAIAATLTALYAGAIDFEQAAYLVIGQNIGTTATALFAAIGASTAAKRTAMTHVMFNVATAILVTFGASLMFSLTKTVTTAINGSFDEHLVLRCSIRYLVWWVQLFSYRLFDHLRVLLRK